MSLSARLSALNLDAIQEFKPRQQVMSTKTRYATSEHHPALHFEIGWDELLEDFHDIIVQAEGQTCFYFKWSLLSQHSGFFSGLDGLPQPAPTISINDASSTSSTDSERSAADFRIVPFPGIDRTTTENVLHLMNEDPDTAFDHFRHMNPYHEGFPKIILDTLRAIDFLDIRDGAENLARWWIGEPTFGYAIAAAADERDVAVEMSKEICRLDTRPAEPEDEDDRWEFDYGDRRRPFTLESISDTARTLMAQESRYLGDLLELHARREKSLELFSKHLESEPLILGAQRSRDRCNKHLKHGSGLDRSDYARLRKDLSQMLKKDPFLINEERKPMRQIVCDVIECGYHPCTTPLTELLDDAKRLYWSKLPSSVPQDGFEDTLEQFVANLAAQDDEEDFPNWLSDYGPPSDDYDGYHPYMFEQEWDVGEYDNSVHEYDNESDDDYL